MLFHNRNWMSQKSKNNLLSQVFNLKIRFSLLPVISFNRDDNGDTGLQEFVCNYVSGVKSLTKL